MPGFGWDASAASVKGDLRREKRGEGGAAISWWPSEFGTFAIMHS